jgi:ATP synthase protein I
VIQSHDDRSSMAMAMVWSSRVTTISLEMALPGVLGIWLDSRWGTSPILTVLGVIAGFSLGMLSLIKLAGMPQEPVERRGDSSDRDSTSKKSTNQESK